MLKNKSNFFLFALQFSVLFQINNAMDRAMVLSCQDDSEDDFSPKPIFLQAPPLFPDFADAGQELIWHNFKSNFVKSAVNERPEKVAGRKIGNLKLINKDMYEYFQADHVLHELTMTINEQAETSRRGHLGNLRARLEQSGKKQFEYRLFVHVGIEKKEELIEILGGQIDENHQFDPRYYSSRLDLPKARAASSLINSKVALANICKTEKCIDILPIILSDPEISLQAQQQDCNGKTPLMQALINLKNSDGRPMSFFILWNAAVEQGVNIGINLQDNNGSTAFMDAAKILQKDFENKEIKDCLVKLIHAGADPYIADQTGITPMMILQSIDLELFEKIKNNYEEKRVNF